MSAPEFSRMVKARHLPSDPLVIEANAEERAALAERFGVGAIDSLRAEVRLWPEEQTIAAEGTLAADLVQRCAVSGEDFAVRIEEPLALRFVEPARRSNVEEIELDPEEWDEIDYEGETFDLGEAVAQTLGLVIDPYACGPGADAVRKQAGLKQETADGPLAEALAALKKT